MKFLSLFAGIGGFDLGLERAGMTCVGQVEIDPYCRAVLAKHWPNVKRMEDVRDVQGDEFGTIDLIAGGFPCQDISFAGDGAGIDGERSGLWSELFRLIRVVRPRYAIVENVAALLVRGMGTVLGDLARIGFDAEWSVLSACAMGATHMRRRLFIVAYPHREHGHQRIWDPATRPIGSVQVIDRFPRARACAKARMEDPSALYRGDDVVAGRLDRNRGIGNAVYPDCAEVIGRAILEAEGSVR